MIKQELNDTDNTSHFTDKEKWVAFGLCWALGVFGAHRFYSGKMLSGFIMLLLSLTFVGLIVTSPWAMVDWIVLLFMSQKNFEEHYVVYK